MRPNLCAKTINYTLSLLFFPISITGVNFSVEKNDIKIKPKNLFYVTDNNWSRFLVFNC